MRNSRGELVEGSTSNLLAVSSDGTLVTPGAAAAGALPGITRGALLEVARGHGLSVVERGLDPGELADLRELFLTSSIRGPARVVAVEGRPVGKGRAGPVFGALRAGFRELVRAETGAEPP